jgi:hypothetical protein
MTATQWTPQEGFIVSRKKNKQFAEAYQWTPLMPRQRLFETAVSKEVEVE